MIPYAATVFVSVLAGSYLQKWSLERAARKRARTEAV